ncbi:MAG: lumenal Hsp70 protein [Chrysothrix sp. TS-e1954]|nr:MAG: lumenal Hsp70 protein [Chrysothrix sp. TS-e1954]
MAAPRERRAPQRRCNTPLAIVLLLLLACEYTLAASAVLGIDLGTEYIKAALVKPGIPLEIVLTKDSKRKETSAIAFKPSTLGQQDEASFPERLYGGDALALAPRYPGEVYPNLKPLLGSASDTAAAVFAYQKRCPSLNLVRDKLSGGLGFQSKALPPNDALLSIEELLAMELGNVRSNAEAMAGKGQTVRDVVITIPPFYTVDERRAVETAAELAGLRVMGLISDGLAVGLNYATSRTFPNVDKGEKPEYHLVYDMGAGSTTATVLKLQARVVKDVGKLNKTIQEVNVVGTGWDRNLGGDVLNGYIMDDMVDTFVKTSAAKNAQIEETTVKSHGRAMAKLWKEAERLRQVLSANTATSAFFEGLCEDIDLRYKLSRAEFEKMAEAFADRIAAPLTMAMASTELQVADLDSIVLHGGAVRTPMIQKRLERLAGDASKLRSNVNADESAVFGAAFKAAGLSPSFRVKDLKSNDAANYVTTLQWTVGGKQRRQNIFLPTSVVGTIKTMQFNTSDNLVLSFSQQVPKQDSSEVTERSIGTFKMSNLTISQNELMKTYGCEHQSIQTSLSLRLDPVTGLPEVVAGTVSCEAADKKSGVVDGFKDFLGFGGKKDQEVLDEETPESIAVSSDPATASESATSNSEAGTSTAVSSKKEDAKKPPKKKIQSIALSVEMQRTDQRPMSDDSLGQTKARLAAFDKSDKGRRLREELFNGLEASTYKARDMLTDDGIIAVSTLKQRDAVDQMLKELGDWIHGDGAHASRDVIKEKLQDLRSLVDPMQKRKTESSALPKAVDNLKDVLNQTSAVMTVVKDQVDKAAEVAAASASSVAEQAASAATATPSTDDDLEASEESPTSSSASAESSSFDWSQYTQADLDSVTSAYESAKKWLEENTLAQTELSASDEPVLLSTDLNTQAEQLNDILVHLLRKRAYKPPKSTTSSRTKPTKSKKSKTSSTTLPPDSESSGSATEKVLSVSTISDEAADSPSSKHQEL